MTQTDVCQGQTSRGGGVHMCGRPAAFGLTVNDSLSGMFSTVCRLHMPQQVRVLLRREDVWSVSVEKLPES